jgi:hypothetical protein
MATFVKRVIGTALLNGQAYEDVESDRSATVQALAVVVLSSLAAGIGAAGPLDARPMALAALSLLALAMWVVWALLTTQIGVRLLPSPRTHADVGELLRTTGFATAPGILRIAGVIPGLTALVFLVSMGWMLMAMIVAVRQALDYTSTTQAFLVCAMGFLLALGFAFVIGIIFAPTVY